MLTKDIPNVMEGMLRHGGIFVGSNELLNQRRSLSISAER